MNEKKLEIAITVLEVTISIFKGIKKLRGHYDYLARLTLTGKSSAAE
ncbi:MAG: hypothetical protein IJF06_03800 [Bacteroidaceae bacterium]|nr:hypothetical protein [Bacteroidaceae bacterium]MBQ6693841.1 hypothetical protein [Bacteroidaceae bacterium]